MRQDIQEKLWPEHTRDWFRAVRDASVPHNFDPDNRSASRLIYNYLATNNVTIASDWKPDELFYSHLKRFVGYCAAPHQVLNQNTPTQPIYLSFFPLLFELALGVHLAKTPSIITRNDFFKNGDALFLDQGEPKVVQTCINRLLDLLLGIAEPEYSFIHRVLINKEHTSNIDDMWFDDNGTFWLRLKTGLDDSHITAINDKYSTITSDRCSRIQELKTCLASADFLVSLGIKNDQNATLLSIREKSHQRSEDVRASRQDLTVNPEQNNQSSQRTKNSYVFHGTNMKNVIIGDNGRQNINDREE